MRFILAVLLVMTSFNSNSDISDNGISSKFEINERLHGETALKLEKVALPERWASVSDRDYYFILETKVNLNQFPLLAVVVINSEVVAAENLHPFMNTDLQIDLSEIPTLEKLTAQAQGLRSNEVVDLIIEHDETFGFVKHFSYSLSDEYYSLREYKVIDFGFIKPR